MPILQSSMNVQNRQSSRQSNVTGAVGRTPRPFTAQTTNWRNRPDFRNNPRMSHVVGSVPPLKPRRSQIYIPDRNDYTQYGEVENNHSRNARQENNRVNNVVSDSYDVRKLANISKWNVSFNGLPSPISVEQFVTRIEILARSEGIPLDDICLSMHYLLTGIANSWFWIFVTKYRNITWEQFRRGLGDEFRALTSDHEIRRHIENRRQKPRESFTEFKLAIESMNTDLHVHYTDNELVSILMNNMHPALKKSLVLCKPFTLNELRLKCLEVEKMLAEVGETLDDQMMCRRRMVNEIFVSEEEAIGGCNSNYQVEENNLSICWNCDDIGHNFQDCPSYSRRVFCYSCGYKDVTKPNCPRCRSNLNSQRGVREMRAFSQPTVQAPQNKMVQKILQRQPQKQSSTQTDV